jgi:hypothetical protein
MPSSATDPLRINSGASGWKADRQPARVAFRPYLVDHADAIDMSRHEVAVEAPVSLERPLEVDLLAALQRAERGDSRRFGTDVGMQVLAID